MSHHCGRRVRGVLCSVVFCWGLSMVAPVAGAAPPSTSPVDSAPAGGEPVGDASSIEAAVDLQPVNADFAPLAAPSPVVVGDVLRTDATGYAEVAYTDGSFTRLDVDTEFTVVALVDEAGNAETRTEMGLGRTWHRVESVGQGDGGFSVETSVATATVTGTAFVIECVAADSCSFVVVEGSLRLELLDGTVIDLIAPAGVDVVPGAIAGPTPLPYGAVFGDTWLLDNTIRDAEAGYPERVEIYRAHGPAYAAFAGSYERTVTVTDAQCATYCEPADLPAVGSVETLAGDFSFQCADDGGCALVGDAGIPYTFDGTTYSVSIPVDNGAYCFEDVDNDGAFDEGEPPISEPWTDLSEVQITPTAAELRDGINLVTEFDYRQVYTGNVEAIPCPIGPLDAPVGIFTGGTFTREGTAVRLG